MELLFTWIEDYRNIRNQGINFSAEFDISFNNQTSTLSFSKRQNYIPLFFGENISNISVIVGENGTGKTSILNIHEATFYIGKKGCSFFLVCNDKELFEKIQTPECVEKLNGYDLIDTFIVTYSNYFDGNFQRLNKSLFPIMSFIDYSTNNLVNNISKNNAVNNGLIEEAFPISMKQYMNMSEIQKQLRFVLNKNYHQALKFKIPEILRMSFSLNDELSFLNEQSYILNQWTDTVDKSNNIIIKDFLTFQLSKQFPLTENNWREKTLLITEKEYALFVLRWSMFFTFINSFTAPNIDGDGINDWLRLIPDWKTKPIEEWFSTFFENTIISDNANIGSKQVRQVQEWANNSVEFISEFEMLLKSNFVTIEIKKKSALFSYEMKSHGLGLLINIDISNKENHLSVYNLLVIKYFKIIRPDNWRNDNRTFLSFSWRGVSSGEIAMLRLFSRFNELIETIRFRRDVPSALYTQSQITHLLFLIDEGEIGLHPTWQKQFLNTLIENIPLMFKESGVESIQLILTTHSPFILSDVPNNHVIFLEKDINGDCLVNKNPLQDKKMTFGANIHSLLSDGFFMKEGLMGDFAKKKINQLIDDLIDKGIRFSDERKTEIKSMIPLIGEPIIRKKIMDLYNEQVNLSIDDRIQSLETEIKKLKAIQNDSNK